MGLECPLQIRWRDWHWIRSRERNSKINPVQVQMSGGEMRTCSPEDAAQESDQSLYQLKKVQIIRAVLPLIAVPISNRYLIGSERF
jgi:hypothetical protein